MKPITATALALTLGFATWMLLQLDAWLGITAYAVPFLASCALFASFLGAVWHVAFRKYTVVFAAVAFAVLSLPWSLPPSSARLLRTAMQNVPQEASVDTIRDVVRTAYHGSGYVLPQITTETRGSAEWVHVSLMSQEAGDCTAISFLIDHGVVVHRSFSAD